MICPHCKKEFSNKEARLRSISENKYYWGVVLDILSEELGYTKTEMHEILKHLFLFNVVCLNKKNGEKQFVNTVKSSSELSVAEFEEYLGQIRTYASVELGIWIPEPNESISSSSQP